MPDPSNSTGTPTNALKGRTIGVLSCLFGDVYALRRHGINPDPGLFFPTAGNDVQAGRQAANEMIVAGFPSTAVFAGTDYNAIGITEALREEGYLLPHNQAVVGFDNMPETNLVSPALSTVTQNLGKLGTQVVDLLARQFDGQDVPAGPYLVETSFLARQSYGCLPSLSPATGQLLGGDPVAIFVEDVCKTLSGARPGPPAEIARQMALIFETAATRRLSTVTSEKSSVTAYDLSMELLRGHEKDSRSLEWLSKTVARVAVLALWTGGTAKAQLDIVGTYCSQGDKVVVAKSRFWPEIFPPAELLEQLDQDSLLLLLPVRTPSCEWGFLAVVTSTGATFAGPDAYFQWAAQQLLQQALYDSLTGLPNRALFVDRLSQSIAQTRRNPGHSYAVLWLDLDGFKVVIDSHGHLAGDELLVRVAERVSTHLREEDTAARFGGDEFAVLLQHVNDPSDIQQIVARLQDDLGQPYDLSGQEVVVIASIGITTSANHYRLAEDVLRDADIAMYQAKATGRAGFATFDASMHAVALSRLQTETDLRQAIDQGQLELHYQPIVELAEGRLRGIEMLVRWLSLEITEAAIMHNLERGLEVLDGLHTRGIQIHIDDFGTGYSSLEALHRLPIDALKIDRTFVANLQDGTSTEVVRTIVQLGRNLGVDVIAEGIETPMQQHQRASWGAPWARAIGFPGR